VSEACSGGQRRLNVLLCPAGSHGDVHPFIALGHALRARGHDVTVVTSAYFDELIRREGLRSAPVGTAEDFDRVTHDARVWRPYTGFFHLIRHIAPTLRPALAALDGLHEPSRTVVAAPLMLAAAARLFCEARGVPLATIHLQPMAFLSLQQPPSSLSWVHSRTPMALRRLILRLADWGVDRAIGGELNALRRELGLPPIKRALTSWATSPDRVIGLFPSWFAPPAPDWPPQTVLTGFPLYDQSASAAVPEALERFLQAGEPPIVFTPGSANRFGHHFLRAGVEACRHLGRRGLLLARHIEQVPPGLPTDVPHFDYAPLSRVLPRAAALVHHGGIGTVAQGLAAGVPQLIMPTAFDQPDNAARLRSLGVGSSLAPGRFHGPAVARELEQLLESEEVACRCREAARRMREGYPLEEACDLIEALGG